MSSANFQPLVAANEKQQYIDLLEMTGLEVNDDLINLQVPGVIDMQIPVDVFLDPDGKDFKEITKTIMEEFGDQIEIFEKEPPVDNLGSFASLRGERRRRVARFYSHSKIKWSGINSKVVKYYKYIELRAPASMSKVNWDKFFALLLCVIGIIGVLALFALIPKSGGASIKALSILIPIVTGACLLIVDAASEEDKNNAMVVTYTAR